MSLIVDLKFAGLISQRLERYKVKSNNPFTANFRCPICGDSDKNTFKARGYFLQGDNSVTVYCHNCGNPGVKHLSDLIKILDPTLYKEYLLETFKNDKKDASPIPKADKDAWKFANTTYARFGYVSPLEKLVSISDLGSKHPARVYLEGRQIPERFFSELYYAEKFNEWTNTILPDKLPKENEEARIVIPFFAPNNYMFGYQGRALNTDIKYSSRYITIMTDKEYSHKVYGLNRFDPEQKGYVTEGPFDSLFLPNCISMAGSDLQTDLVDKSKTTVIYDNDKRNSQIVAKIKKAIVSGYNVVIWNNYFKFKDLNESILGGMSEAELLDIIDRCSYRGLKAQLEFMNWKKVR